MQFETESQRACYEKTRDWMQQLFGEQIMPRSDLPGIGLMMGSAFVQVWVNAWGAEETAVRTIAWVVQGAEPVPELLHYLVRANLDMRFGAFAMDEQGDICFQHTIVGSTLDKEELRASVLAVLYTADKQDDEIVARWGGQRALDKMRG
jgi:hypothetical protein